MLATETLSKQCKVQSKNWSVCKNVGGSATDWDVGVDSETIHMREIQCAQWLQGGTEKKKNNNEDKTNMRCVQNRGRRNNVGKEQNGKEKEDMGDDGDERTSK